MSDSRMTLYEELGLSASASPEDIRKAHRTLARLLHPDQQTDDALRQAAELQMRRLNITIDTLLDPQKRRRYDESLRATPQEVIPLYPVPTRVVVRTSFSMVDLLGILLSAVLVTLLIIWLFGGDFIHLRGSEFRDSVDAESPAAAQKQVTPAVRKAVQSQPAGEVGRSESAPEPISAQTLEVHTMELPRYAEPRPQHKPAAPLLTLQPEPLTLNSRAYPPANMIPMVLVPDIAVPPDNVTPPALLFTGLWLLPSSGRKAAGSARQTPQYIQMSIVRGQNEMVFGEYSARYETPDRPISPEVTFTFQGVVAGKDATFDWNGGDGSRGTVELKLLNPRAMQVAWHVSEFGTRVGFAGGAAVVIRKAD